MPFMYVFVYVTYFCIYIGFYSINILFMSNKAWPLNNFVLREVSKLFKCYVLVKNFDRKPAISLKTLKIGFFNRLI